MSRVSSRLNRTWLSLAIAGTAAFGLMTGCSGPSHDNAPAASSLREGAGAPAPPEQAPQQVQDATRDVVKTASMTITVSNTSEAADKAAVMVEESDGRVDSRTENAGSDRGWRLVA